VLLENMNNAFNQQRKPLPEPSVAWPTAQPPLFSLCGNKRRLHWISFSIKHMDQKSVHCRRVFPRNVHKPFTEHIARLWHWREEALWQINGKD